MSDRSKTEGDAADALAAELEAKLSIQRSKKESKTLKQIASWIEESKRVLVLTGAGVSVAAGIPDFRTPKTGLYDNLQKYNLPYAEAVFDIGYFRKNPEPFVKLASEIWPSHKIKPTLAHSFIALLANKQRLLRNYTQNIDGLELSAGLSEDLLVECHGHFRTGRCIKCKKPVSDMEKVRDEILSNTVPKCDTCSGYVKPDIVFFGENLPPLYAERSPKDLRNADLCLIMGTSLKVPPVAFIPEMVKCSRRILINREMAGDINGKDDLFLPGDCDDSVVEIARELGWEEELLEHHKNAHEQHQESSQPSDKKAP